MQQYKTSKYNYTELRKSDTEPAKCNNPQSANTIIQSQEKATIQSQQIRQYKTSKCNDTEPANETIQSQKKEQKAIIQNQENDNINPRTTTIWSKQMQQYETPNCHDIESKRLKSVDINLVIIIIILDLINVHI